MSARNAPTWLAVLRDLVLMTIGTVGALQEILFRPEPNLARLGVYIAMVGGSTVLNARFLLRNSHTDGPPSG